jgi:tellurite methyltransferase
MQRTYIRSDQFLFLLVITAFLTNSARADSSNTNSNSNHALYEAVTGESADDDKALWDSFYKHKKRNFSNEPIGILREYISLLPKGRALVPAMGEGRNALYLAKHNYSVDGIDISEIAVQKALAEAKLQHLNLKGFVADLKQYKFPESTYDLVVVCLYYDLPLLTSAAFKKTLKKGGVIVIYQRLLEETKGNPLSPEDFFVRPNELKELYKDFKTIAYREFTDQGVRVAALVARKL